MVKSSFCVTKASKSKEDDVDKNELKPPGEKQKIADIDVEKQKCLPYNGPVASTLHTLLQWEARLPSLDETEKKLTLAEVMNGADKETVEFQTDNKICIGLYVPTRSTVEGYCLLKMGLYLK